MAAWLEQHEIRQRAFLPLPNHHDASQNTVRCNLPHSRTDLMVYGQQVRISTDGYPSRTHHHTHITGLSHLEGVGTFSWVPSILQLWCS